MNDLRTLPLSSIEYNQAAALQKVQVGWGDGPMSYREAQEYIQREFTLRLDEAPFDPHDEHLVQEAGACSKCPKRTGNQPELFSDIERGDVCTDIGCFKSKRAAQFERKVAAAREAGTAIIQPDKFGHSPDGYIELDQPCTPANTYLRRNGCRSCRACMRAHEQRRPPRGSEYWRRVNMKRARC